MSRSIRNLTFLGAPMPRLSSCFIRRISGTELTIRIYPETDDCQAYWLVTLGSADIQRHTATGVIAARNAAQNWYREYHAALGRALMKGRAA